MPNKNSRKIYIKNGYYHIYNRGVEKRLIFQDLQDYNVFLSYLKTYLVRRNDDQLMQRLSSGQISAKEKYEILRALQLNNFYGQIRLLCYCLMPNHFHLLVRQNESNMIDVFMNSLGSRYTGYFNKKYKRVGGLFQGVYKAVNIKNDNQLLYLSKYIHYQSFLVQTPSSLDDYLGKKRTEWVSPEKILTLLGNTAERTVYYNLMFGNSDFGLINISKYIIE